MTRIGIFGTGSALRDFLSILPEHVEVVGLGDNNPEVAGTVVYDHPAYDAKAFAALPFDRCVITARAVDPIKTQLINLGVPADRISAYYPSYDRALSQSFTRDIATLNAELGLGLPVPGLATMYMWPQTGSRELGKDGTDFVRRQAMLLVAEMIRNRGVEGEIGELGVYQGETAELLHRLFPERELHLFDTFAGFAEHDIGTEANEGFSRAQAGDFKDTSAEFVLARMVDRDKVRIHQGLFPETTAGVDCRFALVSLDVDLYEPTLAGLHWFYDRLTHGGYIFVHDYNNRRFMGVRSAVDRFVSESGAAIVPLPDFAGSVIITR
jgi:hypothetical protein